MFANEKCPNPECEHPMLEHTLELGCMAEWEYDKDGIAVNQGCECPLTLARDYNPPTEKEYWRVRDRERADADPEAGVRDPVGLPDQANG